MCMSYLQSIYDAILLQTIKTNFRCHSYTLARWPLGSREELDLNLDPFLEYSKRCLGIIAQGKVC